MPDTPHTDLLDGLTTSFIDADHDSKPEMRAQLISNNYKSGIKVLCTIQDELKRCESFDVSVAFITKSGITPLLLTLQELEKKGVPGRILTTDYLTFTEPDALRTLSELSNLEIRFFRTSDKDNTGFHTKGYIFRTASDWRIIVGSSNLTASALTTNHEWNTRVVSSESGELVRDMQREFERLWEDPRTEPLQNAIGEYTARYNAAKAYREAIEEGVVKSCGACPVLHPNSMQQALVEQLQDLMKMPEDPNSPTTIKRGLLISATGTGKTYASAFALRSLSPRRVLFLVHRQLIAEQALESYKRVLGPSYSYGIYIGSTRQKNCDIVFSTMQTMVLHLEEFDRRDFDVIVVDEAHRVGAGSYQTIMNHFEPALWFGMTASPDRPDGFDVYKQFDHKILYEIRLQKALEENLLCPFHYFGISELSVNGKPLDDLADFAALTSDARVEHILTQANYFGHSGDRLKGLVFCSRNDEAAALAEAFNRRGKRSLALTGDSSEKARMEAIERLEAPEEPGALDYIFTVDIFNEGVDIPQVNQIILLRQTESPIVFVQQLGRGLRKAKNKEFTVVLDFIGQYKNNYMIPMALSGDRSYRKEKMRQTVASGNRIIQGASSIHFDEVSRDRIYKSIDSAKTGTKAILKEAWRLLRFKLGHCPKLIDFEDFGSIDACRIFDSYDSYPAMLADLDELSVNVLSPTALEMLGYLCAKIGSGQRPIEALALEAAMAGSTDVLNDAAREQETLYGLPNNPREVRSCRQILTAQFARNANEAARTAHCVFIEEIPNTDRWRTAPGFAKELKNPVFVEHLNDLIAFVKQRYGKVYAGGYRGTALKLYELYSYEDVCRMLNWTRNLNAQSIGGYFYDKETKTLPVFVNYDKHEDAIAYEDRWISETAFEAYSKTNRRIDSADANHMFKRTTEDADNRIYLFIRKNKDDKGSKAFYFLGEMQAQGAPIAVRVTSGEDKTSTDAFKVCYHMLDAVRSDIYEYLNN